MSKCFWLERKNDEERKFERAGRQAGRRTDGQAGRQSFRLTERLTDRLTDCLTDRPFWLKQLGKDAAFAMRGVGARVMNEECDPICAVRACMVVFKMAALESSVHEIDMLVTPTGNF